MVDDDVPFPYGSVGALCMGMLAHSMIFTAPLPYVAFMIVDFGMADNLDTAGYSAGWITGVFMVGRVMSGVPWGLAADKWGRKPCLIMSMVNVCIFGTLFGFSRDFATAMFVRYLIGLGNGFMGIAKTCLSEIVSRKDHEMRAFGYLNGVWGLGYIVGPVIGGMLARPAIQYPSLFSKDSLWGQYPYLLPCLVCSGIAVLAIVAMLLWLPETLKPQNQTNNTTGDNSGEIEFAGVDIESGKSVEMVVATSSSGDRNSKHSSNNSNSKHSSKSTGKQLGGSTVAFQPLSSTDEDEDGDTTGSETSTAETTSISFDSKNGDENASAVSAVSSGHQYVEKVPVVQSVEGGVWGILQNRQLLFLLALYVSFCFVNVFIEETFPLWCVTSTQSGGLAWDSAQVGAVLAGVGVGLVVFQMFLYEPVMKRFFQCAPEDTYFRQLIISIVPIVLMPVLTTLTMTIFEEDTKNRYYSLYVVTMACFLVYSFTIGSSYSTLTIIVNSSVEPSVRGTMNGLVMTAGSLGNFVGPIVGSNLYALIVTLRTNVYLMDGRGIFLLGGLITALLALVVKLHLVT